MASGFGYFHGPQGLDIIQQQQPGYKPWQHAASAVGEGLFSSLNKLAEHKLNEIWETKKIGQRAKIFEGIELPDGSRLSKETAYALAGAEPETQKIFLDRIESGNFGVQKQPQQMQQPQPQQMEQPAYGQQGAQQVLNNYAKTGQSMANPINQPQSANQQPVNSAIRLGPSSTERIRRETLAQQQAIEDRKINQKEQHKIRDTYKKEFEDVRSAAAASQKNIDSYNQIIKLAEKGNVRVGPVHQALKAIGLEDFAANKETQLLSKTVDRLAQNAASAFNTSRLTNLDVGLYKNSLASLKNTKEGIIAIAEVNKLAEEANLVKKKAHREALKNHGNVLTWEILDEADDIAEPKLKELADKALKTLELAIENPKDKYSRFSAGEIIQNIPDPYSVPVGVRIQDSKGNVLVNNGTEWVKE